MRHTKSLRGRSVCVVEVLEIRQLLSGTTSADSLSSPQNLTNTISPLIVNANLPQVNWSGSTTSLTAGQTTISHDLGTDFGYMGVGGGSVTRTYTITNNNASTLNLTGSPDLIQITGAASGDFSVTTAPAASLAPSASTTFTITFTPTAAGTRAAMITIPVGGSASGSFTFNIQGSGLTTTTSNDGLQVATTQAGSGVGAANYDGLKVNYTGYLLDGTKFDSSLNTGRTPFEFTLGVGSVITGWDEGMLGIKVGEKRVLIIPSDLAYGSSGTTGIPGNSILIFEVEALAYRLSTMPPAPWLPPAPISPIRSAPPPRSPIPSASPTSVAVHSALPAPPIFSLAALMPVISPSPNPFPIAPAALTSLSPSPPPPPEFAPPPLPSPPMV